MVTKIPKFRRCVIQNFPFIEEDFDALTDYELLCKVVEYLNKVIESQNEVAETTEELSEAFSSLQNYVSHYFDNLDVQEEINTKLDKMAEDGTLGQYFAQYVNPTLQVLTAQVNSNTAAISQLGAIKPVVVSSTDAMLDHDTIYYLTTDGKWYYWDGTDFVAGGEYTSDVTDEQIIDYLLRIADKTNQAFDADDATEEQISGTDGSASASANYWITDYIPVTNFASSTEAYYCFAYIYFTKSLEKGGYKTACYDTNKDYLGTISSTLNIARTNAVWKDSVAYIRVQFQKSSIAFSERYNVIVNTNPTVLPLVNQYVNSVFSIKDIDSSMFTPETRTFLDYAMIKAGHQPFTYKSFIKGGLISTTGSYYYNDGRAMINSLIKAPKNTIIHIAAPYVVMVFRYTKNGEYITRLNTTAQTDVYISEDMYIRIVINRNPTAAIPQTEFATIASSLEFKVSEPNKIYQGERIDLANKYNTVVSNLTHSGQDVACYQDTNECVVLGMNSSGNYRVYNEYGVQLVSADINNKANITPHANSLCFGVNRYDEGDKYPVFYANAYNNTGLPKGALYCYRLKDDLSTTYLSTIQIGFTDNTIWNGNGENIRDYGNFVIDTDEGYLYAYTMIDTPKKVRFFKFEIPDISTNKTLTIDDIIEYFDVPYEKYIQGVCYFNGKIYSTAGFGTDPHPSTLHVIDLAKKAEVTKIQFSNEEFGEIECAFVKDGTLYLGGSTTIKSLITN